MKTLITEIGNTSHTQGSNLELRPDIKLTKRGRRMLKLSGEVGI